MTATNAMRISAIASVAVVVGTSLSSCEAFLDRPADAEIAVRADGDGIAVTVCDAFDGDTFAVSRRTNGSQWERIWEIDGEFTISSAEPLEWSASHEGESLRVVRDIDAGVTLSILIADQDDMRSLSDWITVPSEGLSTTQWLRPDGSFGPDACWID